MPSGARRAGAPRQFNTGKLCPYCARRVRGSIEEMRQLAPLRGGERIADTCVSQNSPLKWRCAAGHIWTAPPSSVVVGKWRIRCSQVEKYTLEDTRQLAIERGGSCNFPLCLNVEQPLTWECASGQNWQASFASVLGASKCPACMHNLRLKLAELQRMATSSCQPLLQRSGPEKVRHESVG
jgi:hypothetical protein